MPQFADKRKGAIPSLEIPLFHGLAFPRAKIAEGIKPRGTAPIFFDEPDLIATKEVCVQYGRVMGSEDQLSIISVYLGAMEILNKKTHKKWMQARIHLIDEEDATLLKDVKPGTGKGKQFLRTVRLVGKIDRDKVPAIVRMLKENQRNFLLLQFDERFCPSCLEAYPEEGRSEKRES